MNSKRTNTIYELSKQIQDQQQRKYKQQARNIANAYRKVQQIKVTPQTHHKQEIKNIKPQSNYAMKIKQTLKQINANKAKELQSINKYINQRTPIVQTNIFNKLQRTAVSKIINLISSYNARVTKESYRMIVQFVKEDQEKQLYLTTKFRMYKLFRAWRDQILLEKIQKEKKSKQQEVVDLQSQEMAREFRKFVLVKKTFKGWQSDTKKQIKRKKYEQQLIKAETKQKIEEQKSANRKIEQNTQLQHKVRGFLDGLKEKIQQKDRLKTIKQRTQQSRPNENSINQDKPQIHQQINQSQQEEQNESLQSHPNEVIIQPPPPQQQKRPMTNQDLQRKRQQLEHKHKNRKQTLQRLRRQKEEKRRQEQKQRVELQRQIQMEQKRIKQEKYKEYMKARQEQQEWEKKEKQLNQKAEAFNEYRVKKYYGWIPLTSIKKNQTSKAIALYQQLILILFRNKSEQFLRNLKEVSQQMLRTQLDRMKRRYELKLLEKMFRSIKDNKKLQIGRKKDYAIMHEANTLKIFFTQWRKAVPKLLAENYDWQRPRNKRAEQFYKIQLLCKGVRSLRANKEAQQKERCIAEQKDKIKNKIKNMLEEDSFNYEEFL